MNQEERQRRANSGSRRQRDLEAAKPKLGMTKPGWDLALPWAERELPDEIPAFAASTAMVYGASHGGAFPNAEYVRHRLKDQGRDKVTFERPRPGWPPQ